MIQRGRRIGSLQTTWLSFKNDPFEKSVPFFVIYKGKHGLRGSIGCPHQKGGDCCTWQFKNKFWWWQKKQNNLDKWITFLLMMWLEMITRVSISSMYHKVAWIIEHFILAYMGSFLHKKNLVLLIKQVGSGPYWLMRPDPVKTGFSVKTGRVRTPLGRVRTVLTRVRTLGRLQWDPFNYRPDSSRNFEGSETLRICLA